MSKYDDGSKLRNNHATTHEADLGSDAADEGAPGRSTTARLGAVASARFRAGR